MDTVVRDKLALERTRLANERTLLAYIRTALALAAGSAAVFQFFPSHVSWLSFALFLMLSGAISLGIGVYRFIAVKRYIDTNYGAIDQP